MAQITCPLYAIEPISGWISTDSTDTRCEVCNPEVAAHDRKLAEIEATVPTIAVAALEWGDHALRVTV